jgi:hypothetical protein
MLISNLILGPLTQADDAEAWLTQDYGLTAAGGIPEAPAGFRSLTIIFRSARELVASPKP